MSSLRGSPDAAAATTQLKINPPLSPARHIAVSSSTFFKLRTRKGGWGQGAASFLLLLADTCSPLSAVCTSTLCWCKGENKDLLSSHKKQCPHQHAKQTQINLSRSHTCSPILRERQAGFLGTDVRGDPAVPPPSLSLSPFVSSYISLNNPPPEGGALRNSRLIE